MDGEALHSALELAIAGLLWQQPRSGYDLLKVFAETAMGGFSSSPGAVYPALRRLEKGGIITGSVENRDTLRPRQVYRMTVAGIEALKEQLRRPVTRDEVMRHPDGVLLRFAFAGEVLGRAEAIRILTEYARECEGYVPQLRAQLAALSSKAGEYGRYALQRGIDGYTSDARWARRVIGRLKQQTAGSPSRRGLGGRPRGIAKNGEHQS